MIVNSGGDDDMLRLLEAMQVAPMSQIGLKITILRSLVTCLRDSHRTRTIFRKVKYQKTSSMQEIYDQQFTLFSS